MTRWLAGLLWLASMRLLIWAWRINPKLRAVTVHMFLDAAQEAVGEAYEVRELPPRRGDWQ